MSHVLPIVWADLKIKVQETGRTVYCEVDGYTVPLDFDRIVLPDTMLLLYQERGLGFVIYRIFSDYGSLIQP